MSLVSAAANAAAVATPSPSPSPTVTPVIHQVATVVAHPATANALNTLAGYVSQPDLVVAAGLVATAVQSQLNKIPFLQHEVAVVQDVRRFLVSVALPFGATAIASFASGHNTLALSPFVFLVGQFGFYVVKALKASGAATAVTTPPLATEDAPAAG